MKVLICVLLLLFIFLAQYIYADNNLQFFSAKDEITDSSEVKKLNYFWVNFGGGGSFNHRIAGVMSISLQFDRNIVSLRYLGTTEFVLAALFVSPLEEISDISVLYGRVLAKGKLGFVSVGAGIGYVSGVKRGEYLYEKDVTEYYERIDIHTIGVPIELQIFFTLRFIGVGIYGFANINRDDPFIGFAFCLQVGLLSDPLVPRKSQSRLSN